MNLKNARKILIILIIAGVVGSLIYFIFNKLQSPVDGDYPLAEVKIEQIAKSMPSISEGAIYPINIAGDFSIEASRQLANIYNYTPNKLLNDQEIEKIIKTLGVQVIRDNQDPILGRTIIASSGNKSLTLYADRGEITYTDPLTETNTSRLTNALDQESLEKTGKAFISSLGLDSNNYVLKDTNYLRIGGQHVSEVTNSSYAQMIEVQFQSEIDNTPIIDKEGNLSGNVFTIWFDGQANLRKLHFQATGDTGRAIGAFKLKGQDKVEQGVRNNEAKLINGSFPIGEEITSIMINSADLAYYAVENYLIPIYVLNADVTTSSTERGTGYLILEAVER